MTERWNRLWGNDDEVTEEQGKPDKKKDSASTTTSSASSDSPYDGYLPTGMNRPPLYSPELEGTTPVYERPGIRSPDVTKALPLNLNGSIVPDMNEKESDVSTAVSPDTTSPHATQPSTPADAVPASL